MTPAICPTCGWHEDEPPGACCQERCGLAGQIADRRDAIRARLGLSVVVDLPPTDKWLRRRKVAA